MAQQEIKSVLARLKRRMDMLERLLNKLQNPPPGEQRDIINSIAVQGRSITNILQNLRHIAHDFDEWYQPYQEEMRQDEMLRFFYILRSESLKQGKDRINRIAVRPKKGGVASTPEGIFFAFEKSDGTIVRIFYPKPPNAEKTFIGDKEGGAGWIIKETDGSKSKEYIEVPQEAIDISVDFSDPPQTHSGTIITDRSARNLCSLYIDYLRKLVQDAQEHFGGTN